MSSKKRKRAKQKPTTEAPQTSPPAPQPMRFHKRFGLRVRNWPLETWLSLFLAVIGILLAVHYHSESVKSSEENHVLLQRIDSNWDKKALDWLWDNYASFSGKYPSGFSIFFGKSGLPTLKGMGSGRFYNSDFNVFDSVQVLWNESDSSHITLYIHRLEGPGDRGIARLSLVFSRIPGSRNRIPFFPPDENGMYMWIESVDAFPKGFMAVLGVGPKLANEIDVDFDTLVR